MEGWFMQHPHTRTLGIALVVGALLAWSPLASHAGQAPATGPAQAAQTTSTAQGELVNVDAKASTIAIKTSVGNMEFRYDNQTKITGSQSGAAGLATMTGSQVTVQYRKEGSTNFATSIDVRASEKPAR
jgi:hypothetical protein